MAKAETFAKESDLCATFIAALPKEWTAYAETAGFDIVLVRSDGFQIGVEAKLKLNAEVILQAAEGTMGHWSADMPGPDCRAVLVPMGCNQSLSPLLRYLHITCIECKFGEISRHDSRFQPYLPVPKQDWHTEQWYELAPARRLVLPDYVPDVVAGASGPSALTPWKVKAIRIVITLERRGFITRDDFKHFQIDMSRWTQGGWIEKHADGGWVAGALPNFRHQHPINFGQIEADYEKWKRPGEIQRPALQKALF
jgi:hypothetical protein